MKHANSLKTQQQCLFCTCNSLQANQPQRRGNKIFAVKTMFESIHSPKLSREREQTFEF